MSLGTKMTSMGRTRNLMASSFQETTTYRKSNWMKAKLESLLKKNTVRRWMLPATMRRCL